MSVVWSSLLLLKQTKNLNAMHGNRKVLSLAALYPVFVLSIINIAVLFAITPS